MANEKKNLGGLAFLPLLVFLVLYIGTGVILSIMGAESTFGAFPRHVALLCGFAVAMVLQPGDSIQKKTDLFCEHMGNSGVMQVILIYLLASGFQGAAATMGGKESVVNLALHFIPVKLLIPGVFLMCCLISTAIGTSMGTIAAMGPVALSVAQGAGLSTAVTAAAATRIQSIFSIFLLRHPGPAVCPQQSPRILFSKKRNRNSIERCAFRWICSLLRF